MSLAGGEFGAVPGVYGRDYLYPSRANAREFARLGFNLIRLPFKWERLQPELMAAFERGDRDRLFELVGGITDDALHVVLDPHNYAKRRLALDGWSAEHVIGGREVPCAAFQDFWRRLAEVFGGNEQVIFGLMNEPVGLDAVPWLAIVNSTIAAIRETGARNLVLVPGVNYSGAHSWIGSGNGVLAGVRDAADHFAFEVHQYFDRDASGTRPEALSASIGSERIADFEHWARERNFTAFLGEFNSGGDALGLAALDDICRHMARAGDVWLGWAAWAGGPRWPPDSMFNLEPLPGGAMRPQTAVLARHAVGRARPRDARE